MSDGINDTTFNSTLVEQVRKVLANQRRELAELRDKRRSLGERLAELDSEEITLIAGVRKSRGILEELER